MKIVTRVSAACTVAAGLLLFSFAGASANTVIVKPGDTVIKIAERELGDRNRFTEICRLNRRVLGGDCDWLLVGMKLELPTPYSVSAGPANRSRSDVSTLSGDFVARLSRESRHVMNAPGGYRAAPADNFVQLSGHVAKASAGGKPGVWLRVPDSIEQAASGNRIIVDALVRTASEGRIALAYSTNDAGNSGWRNKNVGTAFEKVSFTYKVPAIKNGGGDYIGILPDPDNAGNVLYLAEISVSVLVE